jgi:hypothetical protein
MVLVESVLVESLLSLISPNYKTFVLTLSLGKTDINLIGIFVIYLPMLVLITKVSIIGCY